MLLATKIFLKKNFKLELCYRDHFFILVIIFISNLVKIDNVRKE